MYQGYTVKKSKLLSLSVNRLLLVITETIIPIFVIVLLNHIEVGFLASFIIKTEILRVYHVPCKFIIIMIV